MPTPTAPLSESILFRDQQKTLDLLEAAAKEWAERAARHEQLNDETANLLSQMTLLCLRGPDVMRELWEWGLQQEREGRLRNRPMAGKELRDQLCNWLELLDLIHQSARASEAAGYPIQGAEELLGAADELAAIGKEVNQTWPVEELLPPAASIGLSYQQLRSLADHPPAVGDWPEEDFDRF